MIHIGYAILGMLVAAFLGFLLASLLAMAGRGSDEDEIALLLRKLETAQFKAKVFEGCYGTVNKMYQDMSKEAENIDTGHSPWRPISDMPPEGASVLMLDAKTPWGDFDWDFRKEGLDPSITHWQLVELPKEVA